MKGNIDLKDFIRGVKEELVDASTKGDKKPFFELTEVEMEAQFSLKASAEAEGKIQFLIKLAGKAEAGQNHRVLLKFRPLRVPGDTSKPWSRPTLDIKTDPGDAEKGRFDASVIPDDSHHLPRFQLKPLLELLKSDGIISEYRLDESESHED